MALRHTLGWLLLARQRVSNTPEPSDGLPVEGPSLPLPISREALGKGDWAGGRWLEI